MVTKINNNTNNETYQLLKEQTHIKNRTITIHLKNNTPITIPTNNIKKTNHILNKYTYIQLNNNEEYYINTHNITIIHTTPTTTNQ